MLKLFKDRNFFTLWIGEIVSVIGDHISIIAFPFLVLQLTGSPAQAGFVLAAQGLPRAILMLVGGAIVDRSSPRLVMLISNLLRFALMLLLGFLIFYDQVTIPVIFIIALLFGLADAFFYPAATSVVPSVVAKEDLQQGNAIMQGSVWVGVILGPAIAAFVIAGEVTTLGHESGLDAATYASNRMGYANAFFLDALTFGFSFVTLLFVKARSLRDADAGSDEGAQPSMLSEVTQAIKWVWSVPAIRLGFMGIAVLEFFFQTSIFVGLPALSKARFIEPEYVYGLMIAAYGSGALIGAITGGILTWPRREQLVRTMFLIFMGSGASIGLIVLYEPYWFAMLLFLIFGCLDAYIWVHFTTFVQKATPEAQLGRVMSIFMFMSVGLIPVASVVLGIAFEWNLELSLMVASAIIVLSCIMMALHPDSARVPALADGGDGAPDTAKG